MNNEIIIKLFLKEIGGNPLLCIFMDSRYPIGIEDKLRGMTNLCSIMMDTYSMSSFSFIFFFTIK
jgi:hypothetical protein